MKGDKIKRAVIKFGAMVTDQPVKDVEMIRILLRERIADKEFQEDRKIKLDELVDATGISKNTLSRMQSIRGYNATTDNLNKLCAYFECEIEELLKYVPDAELPDKVDPV